MTFEEFCAINGSDAGEKFVILDRCNFPQGEFTMRFTLVMYSFAGFGRIEVDGKAFKLRRKTMSVFRSGQRINILELSTDFNCKTLLIGGDLGQELSVSSVFLSMFVLDERPVIRVTSEYSEAAALFYGAMDRVVRFSDNPYKRECLLSLLRAFFYSTGYYLFKSLRFSGTDIYRLSIDSTQDSSSVGNRFIKLVEVNAQKHRNLSFYADQLGYNPKYLSSLVKRETGLSGQELIDQYAVLAAMSKLSYTHKSIKEISNDMDFPSQSDFGKFFKRMTGVSPLAYRKK